MVPDRDGAVRALEWVAGVDRVVHTKAGGGRKPYPLETMLRIHLLQNWFSLSHAYGPVCP